MKLINETEKVTACEIWHNGVFIGVSTGFRLNDCDAQKLRVKEYLDKASLINLKPDVNSKYIDEETIKIEKESRKRFDKTISDRLKGPDVNPYRDPT